MTSLCELAPGRYAHASGALWLEAARTAIVADAHLGYGWAQRRRGELGPVRDTKSDAKLSAMVNELRPSRIVFLGDLVHAPKPAAEERAAIESTLGDLAQAAELVLVRGNHDRAFARDFGALGITMVESWVAEGVTALHGDRLNREAIPEGHLVLGHLHPVLHTKDAAGAKQSLRLFLVSAGLTMLPAFSPYAAGFDISRGLADELKTLLGRGVEGVAVTGKSARNIGPLRLSGRGALPSPR